MYICMHVHIDIYTRIYIYIYICVTKCAVSTEQCIHKYYSSNKSAHIQTRTAIAIHYPSTTIAAAAAQGAITGQGAPLEGRTSVGTSWDAGDCKKQSQIKLIYI